MEERMEEMDVQLKQDEMLMQEIEQRIENALEAAREVWMKEMQVQFEQAQHEAEKLSQMSEDERAMHEVALRSAALDEREREIERRELRSCAAELLQQRKLPMELMEAADYRSLDALKASIDAIERAFCQAVQRGIEQRMSGEAPHKPRSESNAIDNDEEYYRTRGKLH